MTKAQNTNIKLKKLAQKCQFSYKSQQFYSPCPKKFRTVRWCNGRLVVVDLTH